MNTEPYIQVGFLTALILIGVAALRYMMRDDD